MPARRAIVMPSLFEEEILHERDRAATAHSRPAPSTSPKRSTTSPRRRVRRRRRPLPAPTLAALKAALDIPVIASLNATHTGGWVRYAALLGDAGADAIELNLYRVAADPDRTAADIEATDLDVVADVRAADRHPARGEAQPLLLVDGQLRRAASSRRAPTGSCCSTASTNPTSTSTRSTSCPASSCRHLGAAPPTALDRDPSSAARRGRVARRHHRASPPGTDAAKALVVGADVAMMTSAILRHGPEHIRR